MLEGSVEAIVTDAERGEDIARCIVVCFFDVIVLEIQKLLIVDGAFGDLPMEKSCIGSNLSVFLAVLD
jgi:hypothetical protein